jgi:hypothetical protein
LKRAAGIALGAVTLAFAAPLEREVQNLRTAIEDLRDS